MLSNLSKATELISQGVVQPKPPDKKGFRDSGP